MQTSYHLVKEMSYIPSLGVPSLYSSLPGLLRQKLDMLGSVNHYVPDQHIQSRGDETEAFSIITKGSVCFGKMDVEGKFLVSAVLKAGQCYGEFPLLAGLPRTHDGITVGETSIRHISRTAFEGLLNEEPELSVLMLKSVTEQLHNALEWIDDLRRYPLKYRLGKALLQMMKHHENPYLNINQHELADMLGVSRVAIGKELKDYKARGFITIHYGAVEITASAAFSRWVDSFLQLDPVMPRQT